MKQKESILLYFPEGKELPEIEMLCAIQHIRVRTVSFEDTTQTVGWLAGRGGYARSEALHPEDGKISEPMMVLCDFSDASLNRFLKALHAKQISVPHKAVLTETNAGWPLMQLFEELCREEAAIRAANHKNS